MKANSHGYIMVLTMVLAVLVSIVGFTTLNSVTKIHQYIQATQSQTSFIEEAKDTVLMNLKYDEVVNSDGLGSDTTICSGGLIINNNSSTTCNGTIEVGSDGIDDKCNDDDRTPYFYNKNISINNFLEATSLLYDNDADARIYNLGSVFPGQEKTIFYYDKSVRDSLLLNPRNTFFSLPTFGAKVRIRIEFLGGGTGTGEIKIIHVNEKLAINQTQKGIVAGEDKGILNESGNLSFGKPFLIDVYTEDALYAINIFNPTSKIWYYTTQLLNDAGENMYQVPLEYSSSNIGLMYHKYSKAGSSMQLKIWK